MRNAKEPTCTEDGYTGDTYCKVCGDKLEDGTKISAAHKLTKVEAKAATTENEGNIEHYSCSVCHKLFADIEGKTELSAADVVIPKKTVEEKPNPDKENTGDNNNGNAGGNNNTNTSGSDNNNGDPGSNNNNDNKVSLPITGDSAPIVAVATVALAAMITILILIVTKKKKAN